MTPGEQTRNDSYFGMATELPNRRAEVLRYVSSQGDRGATRQEIADGLGWKINCVTGRVRELLDSDALIESESIQRVGSSGKPNSVLIVNAETKLGPTAEQIDSVRQYVSGRGYSPMRDGEIVADIMLHSRTGGLWPKGSQRQWMAAIAKGVADKVFLIVDGKVKLAPTPADASAKESTKQLDLF